MEILGKVDSEHVNQFIKKNTDGDIVLFTDKNTAYAHIEYTVETHLTMASSEDSTSYTHRLVNQASNNLKKKLL